MREGELTSRIANIQRELDSLKSSQRIGSGSIFATKIGQGSDIMSGSSGGNFVFRIVVNFGQIALLTSLKMGWEHILPPAYPITMGLSTGWHEYQRHMSYTTAKQKSSLAITGYWADNNPMGGSTWRMTVDVYATTPGAIESAGLYVL